MSWLIFQIDVYAAANLLVVLSFDVSAVAAEIRPQIFWPLDLHEAASVHGMLLADATAARACTESEEGFVELLPEPLG